MAGLNSYLSAGADLVDEWAILVSGGKVWTAGNRYLEQPGDFVLDLHGLTWHKA